MNKYADQISLVREKTISITPHLYMPDFDNDQALMIYGRFSRFDIALINEDKKSVRANIPANFAVQMLEKTREASLADTMSRMTAKTSKPSPAYTEKFRAGILKGMTPAQALAERGKDFMREQYNFLQSNVARYPSNQVLMDAIVEAVRLQEKGELENVSAVPPIVLYEANLRPNIHRPRPDGMCFVYSISIKWTPGDKNPVCIVIENYYAPVVKTKQGLLNVQVAKKDAATDVSVTMNLSRDEWGVLCEAMQYRIDTFKTVNMPAMDNYAKNAEQAARDRVIAINEPA